MKDRDLNELKAVALDFLLERGRIEPFSARVLGVWDWDREVIDAGDEQWLLRVDWRRQFKSGRSEQNWKEFYFPHVAVGRTHPRLVFFQPGMP